MTQWIQSEAFWNNTIGTKAEIRRLARKYAVPKDWNIRFWGMFTETVNGGK